MNKLKKRTIAGFVAASMASTILSPALPAYALNNYGDNVTITFNTGDGPTVGEHDSTWGALTAGTGPNNSTTAVLSGESGYRLTDDPSNPNLISSALRPLDPVALADSQLLNRPQLPDWGGVTLHDSWTGYTFDGWYTEGGTKLERLHPAFLYEDVTYYARWTGNPSNPYDFSVKHLADVTIGGTPTEVEFYATGPAATTSGTTVSTSYKRTIPGYKFEGTARGTDYDNVPRNMRKYGEASGSGTGKEVGSFNSSYVFMGTMPNDDLEVTYRYVADPDKKFNFRVEHVNAGTGTAIALAQVSQKSVGDTITAAPLSGAALTGYILQDSSITAGDADNLSGSGIYGATFAGGAFSGNNFSGVMPNQAVTITYEYIVDPYAQSSVTVSYIDDQGRDLVEEGLISEQTAYTVSTGSTVNIPVPDLQSSGYMPSVNLSYSNLASATLTSGNVAAVTQTGMGTVTIMYVVNQSDTTNWARLTFLSGPNGSLGGNSSPRVVSKRSYIINSDGTADPDFTNLFYFVPADGYMDDGWYHVNASGNPTGSKLDTLDVTGDMKLIYCFKEDPTKWVNIRFAAGANGSVSSSASQHLRLGTAWDSAGVQLPSATPSAGYLFLGWYDDAGNLAWDGQAPIPSTAFITTTYTAKFGTINQETGHDALNRPDASGALASNGSGVITVSNPADNRRYIVTDMDGTVLAELTTAQINGGAAFENLTPGSSYNVYEISMAAPVLTPGSSTIADVTSELRSYPTRVIIPAVGNNVAVEEDLSNENKAQIVIKPAAAGTDYALLDENGNLVYDWVSPSGSPLEVVFDDLDPNTNYIVVTKDTSGTESAESQKDYGTDVLTDIDITAVTEYMIQVLGGTVETVDGVAVGVSEAQAAEGQAVKITAPADVSGRSFKEWKVLLGNISGFTFPSQRTRTITMPAMNVVLVATYEDDPLATSSNASLEYKVNSGHEREVALDLSLDKADDMRAELTTVEDATLIGEGRDVTYRIQFTKRHALATESNAVEAERGQYDDAFKAAFALDVELLRFVDRLSRPVEAGTDPGPIDILIQIDSKDWEHLDYQLWQIHSDGTVSEITPLSADPNTEPEYGGYFMFTGEVNSLYVLSYSKTNEVTITDSSVVNAGNHEVFKVRHGEGLEDSADYQSWSPVDPYTDATGTVWNYTGLSTRSGSYNEFDDTEAIKKNKTVYTYYESDDLDWNDARQQLEDEIQTADDLMNNGSVSQEDKDRLQDAIDEAEAVLNQHPRATTQELQDAYNTLKDVVDSITGFTPPAVDDDWTKARDQLVNEINTAEDLKTNSKVTGNNKNKLQAAIDEANAVLKKVPQPTTQELINAYNKLNSVVKEINDSIKTTSNGNGGGGGGGGGSRTTTSISSKRYSTYTVGVDGNWELIDSSNHSWVFTLTSGSRVTNTWAYIQYTHEGTTTSHYYHFGADGVMDTGWFLDTSGHWYYLSTDHNGWYGHMVTGWHHDAEDQKSYYLDPENGYMITGWKELGGHWYYFSPQKISHTWGYDEATGRWTFLGRTERPYGSMYRREETPDNYYVDDDGKLKE